MKSPKQMKFNKKSIFLLLILFLTFVFLFGLSSTSYAQIICGSASSYCTDINTAAVNLSCNALTQADINAIRSDCTLSSVTYTFEIIGLGTRNAGAATDGTAYAIFGDLRKALAMGERGAMTMKISTEATVDSDNLFEKDMAALRVIERIAIGVLLPSAYLAIVA